MVFVKGFLVNQGIVCCQVCFCEKRAGPSFTGAVDAVDAVDAVAVGSVIVVLFVR